MGLSLALTVSLGGGLAPAYAAPPLLGSHIGSNAENGVGRYQKLELTFDVTTAALNPDLPYEPAVPPDAAHLMADEDARNGVSVDCLLLPPGRTDWNQARIQPAFRYRDYIRTPPPADGDLHPNVENLVQDSPDQWKVRFAPTELGIWQYQLRVTDRQGSMTSATRSFRCVASSAKGFLRVSGRDSRYLQFDLGDSANLIGHNLFVNGYDAYKDSIDRISAGGGSTLIRLWIAARSGQEILGGFANSNGGRLWYFGAPDHEPMSQLTTTQAHSGRFCVRTPVGGELTTKFVALRPNRAYTVSAWVKSQGDATGLRIDTEDTAGSGRRFQREQQVSVPDASGWSRVQVTVDPHDPQNGAHFFETVKFWPQGTGALFIDDVQVRDDMSEADTFEVGDFERHVEYNQRQSWLLDFFVEYARLHGQFLRLNCLENDDSVFCCVAADGASVKHDGANFFGRSTDPAVDLPVRRWQRYYARYLMARWGYATSVAEWEYNNEGPLFNGNHYAAAENFARAIHAFQAEGRRLCGTSFWQNSSGSSYPSDFYDNSRLYPDIDYKDVHYYASSGVPGGSYIPYGTPQHGFVRIPNGGPDGLGALQIEGAQSAGKAQTLDLPLTRVRGRGTWTVSYQVRADADASLNWFGRGPDIAIWAKDLGLSADTIPHNPASPKLPPGYEWRTVSGTFVVPDTASHPITMTMFAKNLTRGRVDFTDIKVITPQGRLWAWYPWNEPLMDQDMVSLAQYLGLMYTSLSGDPSLGKPFSVGECDILSPDGSYNTRIRLDLTGTWMRQFVWGHLNPSGALIFLYTNGGEEATRQGWWKYVGAYQRFLRGIPLTNGRYRNLEAAIGNLDLRVVGQIDKQAGQAHFFVYNRAGNWWNLTTHPAEVPPATGSVTIPGLPAGFYRVEKWNTGTGQVEDTQILSAKNGRLTVSIVGLRGDTAFKIRRTASSGAFVRTEAISSAVAAGQ